MKSSVEKLSSNRVKISFEVEPETFEKGMTMAYRKLVKSINIPGFRKGKAPRKVIELQYGESVFYENAFDAIFPDIYKEAIAAHDLKPVDRPDLDLQEIGTGKPLTFTVEVYVEPDVTLGVYKGIEADKHVDTVEDEDVAAELERARERVSRFIDVTDRPAKLDDQVNIDYEGVSEGEKFAGGAAEGHNLVLGSGNFIPGFEDQLVGATIGQELDVHVTFPDPYHDEKLAGKPATFHVKVNGIQEKEVPALDDEFAKDVSEFDTLAEYREDTRKKLEKQAEDRGEQDFENRVIEAVVEGATVDIPEAMVEDEADSMLRDMQMRMLYQGVRFEDYLRYTGMDEASLRDMYKDDAKTRVKTRLVMAAIKKAEDIQANDEEIDAEIADYAQKQEKTLEEMKSTLSEDARKYFADVVEGKKVVELLKSATIPETVTAEVAVEENDAE